MIRSPLLAGLLPPLTGAYFLALDVWGDEWAWIKNYQSTHQLIFSLLIGIGLLCLFFRALGDWLVKPNFSEGETYGAVLESLLVSITRIIGAKSERFKSKISGIKTNTNTFELITHPKDQIAVILREAKAFLMEVLELKDEQLGITVLRGESGEGPWSYLACGNEHWQHTVPEELLEKRSTAKQCLDTGESRFFADKRTAELEGAYFRSSRDQRHDCVGSIFCTPLFIQLPEYSERFLVTFSTYGCQICEAHDQVSIDATRTLLGEFVQRIEIEATLLSIKGWRRYLKQKTAKKKKKTRKRKR